VKNPDFGSGFFMGYILIVIVPVLRVGAGVVATNVVQVGLCGAVWSAFRLDGESGEMLGHFPLHPLGHPNCTALRVRCVVWSGGGA
jgi:hypothetical protein